MTDFTGLAPRLDPILEARIEGCQDRLEIALEMLEDDPSSDWLQRERRRLLARLTALCWQAMIRSTLAQCGPDWRRN